MFGDEGGDDADKFGCAVEGRVPNVGGRCTGFAKTELLRKPKRLLGSRSCIITCEDDDDEADEEGGIRLSLLVDVALDLGVSPPLVFPDPCALHV